MQLTILEDAVLHSALQEYKRACKGYLQNPKNKGETTKINGEISIIESLAKKVKSDFISQGGDVSLL